MANSKAAGSGQEASRRKRAVSAADRKVETAGKKAGAAGKAPATRKSSGKSAARTAAKKSSKPAETGFITDLDRYLFGAGTHYEIFEKLGAHPKTYGGRPGYYFAVWAPHAGAVHLVGDFNSWNPEATPMTQLAQSGIWECFIPGMGPGELYKFAVTTQSGKILFKADPYANCAEYRPGTASMTTDIET